MSVLVSEEPRTMNRRTYLWSLAVLLPLVGVGDWLVPPTIGAKCCDSVCPLCDSKAKAKKSCCDSVCPLCDSEAKGKAKKSCCGSKTAAKTACCSDEETRPEEHHPWVGPTATPPRMD